MADPDTDPNLLAHRELARRFRHLSGLRPAVLATLLIRLIAPDERRRIVCTTSGVRLYLDPFTHLGQSIVNHGDYEPETAAVLHRHLEPGFTFLDVGANEGYFSALAARVVGPTGVVMAVEPQTRLSDIIEINLRLNGAGTFRVFNNALGGEDGETGTINLWPSFNTGASSILARYRFSRSVQAFRYISLDTILTVCKTGMIDFAKVDVEGFEGQVVGKMMPHIAAGKIRRLFIDYHEGVLRAHGIEPRSIHDSLLAAGCRVLSPQEPDFRSYVLYENQSR